MQHEELCKKILDLDSSVRFAALADHLGSLLTTVYRQGLTPLAAKEETAKFASQAVFMTGALGVGHNSKIGRMQYVVGRYENLIRATIPVVNGSFDKFYLMLSFDVGSDVVSIIEKKILPFLKENSESFS
ncbi:MAG: hypothetical protein ACREAY_09180 [Nitrososphaera sp.]|uniref:hypothetical protein n=1 Tax=Nitrososphaera sp. TaxID=1971748 RepID=UPI003D6EE553